MAGAEGAVLSTVTVTVAELCAFPAESVVTTWRSKSPFRDEVFQLTECGVEVSVPMAVQAPPPAGRRSKTAEATPEPESAESDETETVLERNAPPVGDVTEPLGSVRSTSVETTSEPVFEALSVMTARRAWFPSPWTSQDAVYGAVVSGAPSELHEPPEHPVDWFEQTKNSTPSISVSGLVAVTVNGSAAAPFTYAPGAVIETVGAWLSTLTVRVAEVKEFP